jgi:hypothetical protein
MKVLWHVDQTSEPERYEKLQQKSKIIVNSEGMKSVLVPLVTTKQRRVCSFSTSSAKECTGTT